MFFLDPISQILILSIPNPGSRIPDFGSRIQKQQNKRGLKKISCRTIFAATKITKLTKFKIIFILNWQIKIVGQFAKNFRNFYPKNCHEAVKNMGLGSGIQDPGSRIWKKLFRIQDPGPGDKKAPDPGSGSATLIM
jgi:hypothetical protein